MCVAVAGRGRHPAQGRRPVAEERRGAGLDDVVADADIRDHELAAELAAGQQQVSGPGAAEGDRERGAAGEAPHLAAVAIETAGHIDGHAFGRAGGERGGGGSRDIPRQPGPEHGIHDQRRLGDGGTRGFVLERQDGSRPASRHPGRRALQPLARAQQGHADRPAGPGQMACRHEAVASVVARTAEHDDGAPGAAGEDGVGHRASRVLHQIGEVGARRRRGAVAGTGLRHGEQRRAPVEAHRPVGSRKRSTRMGCSKT